MKTYDISLFNLDNYQWTEYLYAFYDSIAWIEPDSITGYSKQEIKEHNLKDFNQGNLKDLENESADELIADYYLYCFQYHPNLEKFIDASLWLVTELADSTPVHIFPPYIKSFLKQNTSFSLDDIFEKIDNQIQKTLTSENLIIPHYLANFAFEIFQLGGEWGTFCDANDLNNLDRSKLKIDEAIKNGYFFIKLSDNNVRKLASLEKYNLYPK